MRKWMWYLILNIIILILFTISMGFGEENFIKRGKSDGISFLSGGVGISERETLNKIGKNYSLKMIFSKKNGEYLSDIVVRVLDQQEKLILTTNSNGPWLFIDLPSGIYQLEAGYKADHKKIPQIKIEKGLQKVIHIQW